MILRVVPTQLVALRTQHGQLLAQALLHLLGQF